MYLGSSQLHVGGVHLAAQHLVEGCVACEDDGLVGPLHAPPAQAGQVCTDAHSPADGEHVSLRGPDATPILPFPNMDIPKQLPLLGLGL